MQGSKTVSESLSSQWRLCCSAGVKNKWRLKHNLRCETHFLSCVCVWWFGGRRGREMLLRLLWRFNFRTPPLHTYTQTHASLRLTHPDSLARTKKQIFLRGIPSVVEAASGFTNWSERGLGERVPRWGSLLTYASSQICWAWKLHKTMLISGILSVLWGAGGGSQTGNQ